MTDAVPADLLVVVCEALEAADSELESIAETPILAPDALSEALRRGEVAQAVLRRILRAAPPERKRRLGAMCREEREAHLHVYADAYLDSGYPVLPEVTRTLGEARETIRRRALSDRAVADALREVEAKGWAW